MNDKDKSVEKLKRDLEEQIRQLDKREDRKRSSKINKVDKMCRLEQERSQRTKEVTMRIVAGLVVATISFLGAEMWHFNNKMVEVDQMMKLLVTPDFKIVPSAKHADHELAREHLESRISALESALKETVSVLKDLGGLESRLIRNNNEVDTALVATLRSESHAMKEEITASYRRELSQSLKVIEDRLDVLYKVLTKVDNEGWF